MSKIQFTKAKRKGTRLRMAIQGVSGSGKTYTALAIATALRPGKVAVLDTEYGSASKYGDIFDFDVVSMNAPFAIDKYVAAIAAAAEAEYSILVIDSLSHAWSGEGGLLDALENWKRVNRVGDGLRAWAQFGNPEQDKLKNAILSANIDIIATMRSKSAFEIEKSDTGKVSVRKMGMKADQRDNFDFEFDIVAEMDNENVLAVTKSRCVPLNHKIMREPNGNDVADILKKWLNG